MEVATTNNHSQSHHHHHHRLGNGSSSSVSVGGGGGGSRSPFQREVREWQRIDPDTGALFSGRLEADRWINGPLNSYGKISDSQNISQPNGTQHTQRKQLEVLRTANGAMQVIRTQTVQKSSSTSRHWSSTTTSSSSTSTRNHGTPAMVEWAPRASASDSATQGHVDICELSDSDESAADADDHLQPDHRVIIHNGSDAGDAAPSNGYGQELVDDHVDFVVINGQADADADDDDDVAHLHKLGHNLLPDTAPSLKLSNLMKSSSSISSQSSNNSNLTTAATAAGAAAGNTHRNASKISLHAIVGQPATAAAATTTTAAATASSSAWPKQSDLYGQSKQRVGVTTEAAAAAGDADVDVAAAAAMATPTQRRDLESFRHYNDDDDDLRLSARHQRRQQVSQSVYAPPLPSAGVSGLQRSRSISTDDLSNEWQLQQHEGRQRGLDCVDCDVDDDDDVQPCGDWRRVSKLRRSFQSQDYHKATARPRPRPLDLPSSSVSVARIRAELENGRRLNTAMRNNHVDLAALDNILNPSAQATTQASPSLSAATGKPQLAKRSTFLTAESLQEIRGKLKKLSDESLYKEDFLAHQDKPAAAREPTPPPPVAPTAAPFAFRAVHNTHSLETRQRPKDTSSSEWHLRRKSYGFEKMSPPESRSIFRVDASTDSGLGRSGEQLGNWSPTDRSAVAAATGAGGNGPGSTIIHFGRQQSNTPESPNEGELSKRHSIAVEETWRDIRKTSQVHVNGESVNGNSSSSQLQRSSAQKRVEFCKTEVHFAAESGRVNIVETDGKPPPTQNFRRRRRTASGPLQSLVKAASVTSSSSSSTTTSSTSSSSSHVTHFGDDPTIRSKPIASSTVAYRATLMDPPELVTQPVTGTQVTVITGTPKPTLEPRYSLLEATSSTSRHSYTSTSGVDTTDNETDELANIRGILKNKPIKPKPYHLGENIESADVLWSVPASIKSERESSPPNRESATNGESPITTKSVAERVRIVEQRQFDKQQLQQQPQPQHQHQQQPSPAGNGYSTKINVSLGADEWTETGRRASAHRRSSAQELLLQDLRAHQRILDEGLKSTSLIMKTMRSASEFDEAMRRLSIASIESALLQPTIVVPTPMLRSHSYQEESSSRRSSTTMSIASSDLFGSALHDSLPRTPLAPPRLKLLGNTQIPVSQQLTQLRRLYDAAEQEEDSADEEVKRYFRDSNSDSGGGTQCSSSPEEQVMLKGSEYSSSWSRLKAKRTIWKIEAQEQTLKRADLPKSNVMNIALHAPRLQKPKATPPTLRIGQLVPVAKPRTLLVQPQLTQLPAENGDESGSESLKIVKETRGARKLREHELAYFGVQQSPTPTQSPKLQATPSNPRRTLPTRSKLSHSDEANASSAASTTTTTTTTTKWQLLNDRPDLLRHSPQGNDERMSNDYQDDDEHCYENIANELTTSFRVKSPSPGTSYERKADLQRDAQILSEMTRNADQTLKALSDEAAFKDQRRRSSSLQRRSAKPLATIDEKVKGDAKALSVARGTFASEARRNSRTSTPSPTRARSSSQSSIECCPRDRSRSSSRESMTHGGGSSDEQISKQRVERLRMRTPKREKSHEHRTSRQSVSKPRSTSSAMPESSKRSHHHSRHRDKEHTSEHAAKHSASSAGSRLLRSSRVSEESPRPRISSRGDRERERERSRGTEKQREELTRSRGHSSRSRHSEQAASGQHKASRSSRSSQDTAASTHRKSTTTTTTKSTAGSTTKSSSTTKATATTAPTTTTTATHNELTYVYVTNLANTQTTEDYADYASIDETSTAAAAAVAGAETLLPEPLYRPEPPPRRKRRQSLIPVPVQRKRSTATPSAAYEHRMKQQMIPVAPSYSNQSTLRCKAKARATATATAPSVASASAPALQPRKPSLRCTQSTSSSFAFLPAAYTPAKRNSSVSHVYDNYLLYAAPATLQASKLRPYQHNLSNEHAQLFGSSGRGAGAGGVRTGNGHGHGHTAGALASRLGSWPKRLRMRQVRSSVSTHQPFGICTCS
ncbi:hypothetical protein KR222_001043 [Zaprionus bogoriensis]|nr:hypothetical protein KR222_001043 [Zaprionus bogoriensis]